MSGTKHIPKKGEKERKMAVLTANCKRAFAVSPEKAKAFMEQKSNKRTNEKQKENLQKITAKIRVQK